MPGDIAQRKQDHLDSILDRDVRTRVSTGLEQVRFEHVSLPELNFHAIDLGVSFLGRALQAPLLVSSMTGGPVRAAHINETIAEVAQSLQIAFAVGSQRIAWETQQTHGLTPHLRRLAPSVPILANIGASQLKPLLTSGAVHQLIDMIEADALIIHLNPLQEVLQAGGDTDWSGILGHIETLVRTTSVPLVVKEVGFGISASVARKLWQVGVTIIDVAGVGGTSWAAVEADRAQTPHDRAIAETFRNWGIPTAAAIRAIRDLDRGQGSEGGIEIIASGGLRNGLEVAQALRLGASLAGFAGAVLPAAIEGPRHLQQRLEQIITELKIAAFCTGSATIADLKLARLV